MLLLERKLSLFSGLKVRIRRIPLEAIVPGAVVDGPTIFKADLFQVIDNMAGLDAHLTAEGDTMLTMVSDTIFRFCNERCSCSSRSRRERS